MTEKHKRARLRPLLSGVVLRAQSDERLAALASTGNQQAFNAIFERYRRELGSHASRIVRSEGAEDVVQHTMLAAWNALLAGAEISDLRAWLHRVTHNAALDTINRRGYHEDDIPASSIAPSRTDELAEGRLSAAAALAALAALPESQRRALTLTAIAGRSGHDAALEMGISESAMRQLVYRARSTVRSAVTVLTPLPLLNWLLAAAGGSATPAAISLGAAGGGAATIAKVVAVIGVTAATIGATHPFQTHHLSWHTRNVPTSPAPSTTADRRGPGLVAVSRAAINAPSAPATNSATGKFAGEQHRNVGQTGQSQQGSGNHAGHQSGSGNLAIGSINQQSGNQQQSGANQSNVTAPSVASNGPQLQQSNEPNSGATSGQSGASPSPALPTGQSGGANR